jgi:hypothetical protein
VANWKGTAPGDHPANAPEALAVKCVVTPSIYYNGSSDKGGNLILDVTIIDWDSKVSSSSGIMEDYRINVESTVLSGVYQANSSDMLPVATGDNYYTYHLDIPADNITSKNDQEYWVIVECKGQDYTNKFGVPNNANLDKLAGCFRYPLHVSTLSPQNVPVCDLVVVTPMPHLGKGLINFDASGSTDADTPDGDVLSFSWDFDDDGIFGDAYDDGPGDKPWKDYKPGHYEKVSVKVSDLAGHYSICSEEVDITVLREVNWSGAGGDTWFMAYGMTDLACNPDADAVAMTVPGKDWLVIFTSQYNIYNTYTGAGCITVSLDCLGSFVMFGTDCPNGGVVDGITWNNWSSDWGTPVVMGVHPIGVKGVWNQQGGTPTIWALFDYGPDSDHVVFIRSQGFNDYEQPWPYSWAAPWYNGSGSTGVILNNLIAVDMAPWVVGGFQTIYTLEAIPSSDTGVVEAWTLASSPVYKNSFGQGLLHDPLDMSVDSQGNVYILDMNSANEGIIWVYDPSGTLIGTTDPFSWWDNAPFKNAIKLDCDLYANPDRVHVLFDDTAVEIYSLEDE